LARGLIWAAAWDMLRDAEMPVGDWLSLVESGLDAETDVGVVQTVLSQTRAAVEQFAAPEHYAAYRTRLADLAMRRMLASAPGSDHQLAFARAFASAARGPEQVAVVRAWLSGDAPEGLAVDTDLRWALLQKLVAVGAATAEEIDAELASDDTAAGRRQAAVARAAIPTMQAKETAWAAVVESDELPNALLNATIGGFVAADQRDLHRAFLPRYFAALPSVWTERTNETAQSITLGFYPAQIVEQDTLDLTDAFLARDDVPAGARRLVQEGRDGIVRSLRCQERDSAG
jgi:aminopeptidase N